MINQEENILDFLPAEWKNKHKNVWVSSYRVLRVSVSDFESQPLMVEIGQTRAIIIFASSTFLDTTGATTRAETPDPNQFVLRLDGTVKQNQTPLGAYLLIFAPYDEKDPTSEGRATSGIDQAVGFLSAFNGHNMAYEHYYDNVINLGDKKASAASSPIENPLYFRIPDLKQIRIDLIQKASKSLFAKPEPQRNRVLLSLRWFKKALFTSGVDAFLSYWIALETLGMPDTANIKPLVESLSKAYQITFEEAKEFFSVGRISGLRNDIVHNGKIKPINGKLLTYMEGLYIDILFFELEIKCEQQAKNSFDDSEFNLADYLRSL